MRRHETMLLAIACDRRLAVEMPPGDALARLGRPLFPNAVSMSQTHPDSVRILVMRET